MLEKNNIPKHIAIIMDGNGRWARERGLSRTAGHREGIKRVKEAVKCAAELGVKIITFFAFSTENWRRPKSEINALMRFLNEFLEKQLSEIHKNNIRFLVVGRQEPIPSIILKKIEAAQEKTKDNNGLLMVLALNYGSRQEIVDAAKKFCYSVLSGEETPEGLDVNKFNSYLYTAGLVDPDLLIRTSGEMRMSNFLLWQLSYSELYFSKKYWPDFRRQDLEEAIEEYKSRERRFGAL